MNEDVRLRRKRRKNSKEVIEETMNDILQRVSSIDHRFDFLLVKTGSDFQRVAIRDGSDYDFTLVFKNENERQFSNVVPNTAPGYSVVELTDVFSYLKWFDLAIVTPQGATLLSSKNVLDQFFHYIQAAIQSSEELFDKVQDISVHGPAVTLTVQVNETETCEVDMTVAFPFSWPWEARESFTFLNARTEMEIKLNGILVVPKQNKHHHSKAILWYASFVEAENALIRVSDPGCRRTCLRIVKALCNQAEVGLTSFHLKNIWLYECNCLDDDEWIDEKLGERVIGILKQIRKNIISSNCPHFFLPDINLFRGMTRNSLRHLQKQVSCLINELRKVALDHFIQDVCKYLGISESVL